MGGPGVQVSSANTHEAASQIQPDRTGVVLHHPVNRIARQSVPARERENVAVFDPAQPTRGGGPQCAVPIDVETADLALSQALGATVRGTELTVPEVRDAIVSKSKP